MLGVVGLMTVVAIAAVASATVMPIIARELDALDLYVWGITVGTIMSLLGIVLGGILCDTYGPRVGLLGGVAGLTVGSLLIAVSPNFTWFIGARLGQGLGAGILMVTAYVIIARAIPDALRPRAMAALAAAWVVPTFAGAVLAGVLADTLGWRLIYAIIPVVALGVTLIIAPRLRALSGTGVWDGAGVRIRSAAIAVVGLLLVQDGMTRANIWGLLEASAGIALVVLASRNLLPSGALTFRRGLPSSVMMRGIVAAGYFGSAAFLPLVLIETRGASATQAGFVMGVAGFAWWIGSSIQGRYSTPQNASKLVAIGSGVVASSLALMPVLVLAQTPIWAAAVILAVSEIGLGLALPAVSVQVFRLSREERQGFNSSALQIVDTILSAMVAALLTAIYASAVDRGGAGPITFAVIWIVSAIPALLGVFLASRMRPR
ncbi:MAG: MFS transporter [Actinomycetales bacterium]